MLRAASATVLGAGVVTGAGAGIMRALNSDDGSDGGRLLLQADATSGVGILEKSLRDLGLAAAGGGAWRTPVLDTSLVSMVGFTYRRVPAVALARQLVQEGRLGEIRHVRAQYLQDWLADEKSPLTWRLDKERAGSGALGDIGAHIIDAVEFVTGQQLTGLSGMLETFVKERPLPAEAALVVLP